MNVTFKAMLCPKWTLKDDCIIINGQTVKLEDIIEVKHVASPTSSLMNGLITILEKKNKYSLAYPYKQKKEGDEAAKYIKENYSTPEKREILEKLSKKIDEEIANEKNKEIRKRCNVCGHIFCYNQSDIKKNKDNAKSAMLSGVGQIAGAVGGAYTASAVNHTNAQNSLNKIVDFNRCPQCNSTDLAIISDEEFEKMKAQNQATQQPATATVSVADELKKFKELLDMGAITQEEFDAKKKELLGL